MATIEDALIIAATAHRGQTDKEKLPYILHPLRVMQLVRGPEAQMVAILHDVVEDTSVTLEDLRKAGFSETVLEALKLATHLPEDSYADYVVRLKPNPIARQVKLGDLQDNSLITRQILRLNQLDRDFARMGKYLVSYKFLTDQISETEYRTAMKSLE